MKILYLANLRLPTEKGYGIQIAKTCEAMADLGHDVTLVYPFRINKIKDNFFDYYSVKNNFTLKRIWALDFYFPGILDKLAVNIKNLISGVLLSCYALSHRSDLIYTRDEWPAYFLSFFGDNIIFEAHKFYQGKRFFYKRFRNKKIKLVAISGGLKSDFVSFGISEERVLVAHDGVDFDAFNLQISRNEAREKTQLPPEKKIVMYTGHLFGWKGAGVLLEVARNFQNEEDVLFVFVGGTERDIEGFRKKAEGLNNVLILGHKPYGLLPAYLKAADVLVLPNSGKEDISSKYTSPIKLFEYMASKRPIIASDLPSIREVLNEQNAVLVKPDNPSATPGAIINLLDNLELGGRISEQAFNDVQEYTWQKRAEKILNFLSIG